MLDQAAERAVLDNPLGRSLLPHPGDTGQIVTGIAPECGEVGVLRRSKAVLLFHRLRCHPREIRHSLAWVEHGGGAGDQLEGVTVARDDRRFQARRLRLSGEGCDEVISFVALTLQVANTHSRKHIPHEIDLTAEFVRCLGSRGLVALVCLATERGTGYVKSDGDMGGVDVAQSVDEHRGESVDGIRRLPGRRGEVVDG